MAESVRDFVVTTSMSVVDQKVNWYERYVSTVVWPARNPPAPPVLPEYVVAGSFTVK